MDNCLDDVLYKCMNVTMSERGIIISLIIFNIFALVFLLALAGMSQPIQTTSPASTPPASTPPGTTAPGTTVPAAPIYNPFVYQMLYGICF